MKFQLCKNGANSEVGGSIYKLYSFYSRLPRPFLFHYPSPPLPCMYTCVYTICSHTYTHMHTHTHTHAHTHTHMHTHTHTHTHTHRYEMAEWVDKICEYLNLQSSSDSFMAYPDSHLSISTTSNAYGTSPNIKVLLL